MPIVLHLHKLEVTDNLEVTDPLKGQADQAGLFKVHSQNY